MLKTTMAPKSKLKMLPPPVKNKDRPAGRAAFSARMGFGRVPAVGPGASMLARLSASRPGDRYEQEADRVAESVLSPDRAVAPALLAGEITPVAVRDGKESDGRLFARVFGLQGGGNLLENSSRRFMEPRLGYDFGRVRVNTGGFAARACERLGAEAFTVGSNIYFSAGRYSPETQIGKRLLAHELVHVMQQRNAPALQAYGRNVHETNTKLWAEAVFGRGSREADTIAREDQSVDEGWSHPHITTPTAFVFPVSDNDLRHFPSRAVAQAAVQEAINGADPAAFGRALHRYQDSFSHSFPPGAPMSDLSRARSGATGWTRDALLQLHRLYRNTYYGRGAAIWHALLGYYPDDFGVNSEQGARDAEMERGSKNHIRMFHSIWRTTRLIRVPVPPGLTVPGMLFGPHHVAPYMRRD